MKKFIFSAVIISIFMLLSSQTMVVHLTNGETFEIDIAQITSITFSENTSQGDIAEIISKIPIKLLRNYPNPFNPTTTIAFELEKSGKSSVNIYNMKGQKVKTLLNEELLEGKHFRLWDGKNDNGKRVASGMYFYKVALDGKQLTRKMILMK